MLYNCVGVFAAYARVAYTTLQAFAQYIVSCNEDVNTIDLAKLLRGGNTA